MNLDELTIGQARQLSALFGTNDLSDGHLKDEGLCLVVADRGHVWVGRTKTDASRAYIEHGRIVRIWGTTRGLNELAASGPLSGTKIDAEAPSEVRVERRAIIAIIPCAEGAWKL